MAKKKKSNIKQYVGYGSLVLGVLAVCMGFLAAVTMLNKLGSISSDPTNVSLFQVAFGYKSGDTQMSNFSFFALLAILLPLAGGLLAAMKGKLFNFIAIAAFIAGAVLMFCSVPIFEGALTDGGKLWFAVYEAAENVKLGVGAILGGIFSIIGALATAYKTFAK